MDGDGGIGSRPAALEHFQSCLSSERIGRDDHAKLHAAGFDDKGILQITLIASWFNYINRVADALGVGRD